MAEPRTPPTVVQPVRSFDDGGTDDTGALPATTAAAVAPGITALRWGAVAYAVAVVAPGGSSTTWSEILALAVCVFLTALRTLLPLQLDRPDLRHRAPAVGDAAVFALAAGWTGGTESPFVFCVMAAVAIAAFGWGWWAAATCGGVAVVGVVIGTAVSVSPLSTLADSQRDLAMVMMLAAAASAGPYVRNRIIEAESATAQVADDLTQLREANELLGELADIALSLPGSFTLREALQRTREQLATFLDPSVVALFTLDEHNDEWAPKLSDRCALRAAYPADELPEPLATVLAINTELDRPELSVGDVRMSDASGSGLYLPLRARDRVIGLLALEHPSSHHFDHVDAELRDGLASVVALTIDNARWFGRLRTLGAEEERIRVARDIHDRLGQWMTYIKLELERLSSAPAVQASELRRLHDDAAEALDELRETLRQLRSGVSDDRPLSVLGRDLVARFADRTDVAARFTVADPTQRLPVPVENELLRILQEALNNVDRHAKAEHVEVSWVVDGGNYELVVTDDGRGFDPSKAVREQAYGMVGMRERAEVIGASLRILSTPGNGTTVTVSAGRLGEDPPRSGGGSGQ